MNEKIQLFGKNISANCKVCENSEKKENDFVENNLFCKVKNQNVSVYDECDNFIYNPLKRTPPQRKRLPKYNKSDFEI